MLTAPASNVLASRGQLPDFGTCLIISASMVILTSSPTTTPPLSMVAFHFTPKSGSWLNAVEGFFSKFTRQRIRRGVFRSIVDLQAAINRYLAEHNDHPKPFAWTKPADAILANFNRLPVPSV